jgi:CheY-like chemotaxis protein
MALVLCTGAHPTLVHTRKFILERADHTVVTALDNSSLEAACRQHNFDVVVICQSGSPALKREWMSVVRKHRPSAKVLEVYTRDTGTVLPEADSWLEAPTAPDQLADCLSILTGEKKHSTQRRALQVEEIRSLCTRAAGTQDGELDPILEELLYAIDNLLGDEEEKIG